MLKINEGVGTDSGVPPIDTPTEQPTTHDPVLRKYTIRVYDGYIEIESPLGTDLRSYVQFREDITAAEKAILREVYVQSREQV